VERIFIGGELRQLPYALGRMTLLSRLGQGGMAELFVAELHGAHGFRRRVVAKRIRPDLLLRPRFAEMFTREAEVLARLKHPNIVDFIDFIDIADEPWLLLEHIEGPTIRELLSRHGRLPVDACGRIVAGAASALAALHTAVDDQGTPLGLMHRDVSLDNLMVTPGGTVKLLDFGIVKGQASPSLTTVGALKGKLPYLAPEQLLLKPVDARTDLYALGVCFYELVCGRRPFMAASDILLMDAIVSQACPLPAQLVAEAKPVEALILWLMARNIEDRPANAALVASLVGRHHAADDTLPRWLGLVARHDAIAVVGVPRTSQPASTEANLPAFVDDDSLEATVVRLRPRPSVAVDTQTPSGPGWWSLVSSLLDDEVVEFDEHTGTASRVSTSLASVPPPPSTLPTVTMHRSRPAVTVPSPPPTVALASRAANSAPAWKSQAIGVLLGIIVGAIGAIGAVTVGLSIPRWWDSPPLVPQEMAVATQDTPQPAPTTAPTTITLADSAVAAPTEASTTPTPATADSPRPRPARTGRLTVLAVPWAEVYVDGKRVGVTPIEGLKLDASRHRVRLQGPNGAVDREVTIVAGRNATLREAMP
jgi:serine/threonine-protein kinase